MDHHIEEKSKKITKAALLKQLKQLDRYKKEYFSYTVVKLQEVLKQIQEEKTHIIEPIFESEEEEEKEYQKPIKTVKVKLPKPIETEYVSEKEEEQEEFVKPIKPVKVKKEKKEIQYEVKEEQKGKKEKFIKADKRQEEPEEEKETEPEPEYIQPNKQKFKKELIISKPVAKVKVPILKRVLFSPDEYKKDIQKIMKDLKLDIDDLLHDFDTVENLTEDDANIIKTEYGDILEKAYDNIESILEKFPTDLNYHKIIERKIKLIDDKVKNFLLD
jgi:hypothetical protein